MPQVKFLKGRKKNLAAVPLDNGSIYFTSDERRLYVDTPTARLPVTGDIVAGKIFYALLPKSGWNTETKEQVIEYYLDDLEDTTADSALSNILTEDTILFIGKAVYSDGEVTDALSNIICQSSNANSIIFKYLGDNLQEDLLDKDVHVQIYSPNPKVTYSGGAVSAPCSVYSLRETLDSFLWEYDEEKNQFIYNLPIEDINLTSSPYIVSSADNSLENTSEYARLSMSELWDDSEQTSYLIFTSNTRPSFNITIDITMFIASSLEWNILTLSGSTTTEGGYATIKIENQELADISEGEQRELLVYCLENPDEFEQITDIKYNDGTYTIYFNKTTTLENNIKIMVQQLNNIANIYKAQVLTGGENKTGSKGWLYSKNFQGETFLEDKNYYIQSLPAASANFRLKGKHPPLIYPSTTNAKDLANFNKIIETKVYQGKILFYTEKLITDNLPVTIIDFI